MVDSQGAKALEREILRLYDYIQKMRVELASVAHPGRTDGGLLDSAADQLNAIAAESGEATQRILDATNTVGTTTEKLLNEIKLGGARPLFEQIAAENQKIIDACGFHDVVSQRIASIVHTINLVEGTLNSLVVILGEDGFESIPSALEKIEPR